MNPFHSKESTGIKCISRFKLSNQPVHPDKLDSIEPHAIWVYFCLAILYVLMHDNVLILSLAIVHLTFFSGTCDGVI